MAKGGSNTLATAATSPYIRRRCPPRRPSTMALQTEAARESDGTAPLALCMYKKRMSGKFAMSVFFKVFVGYRV